MLNGIIAVPPTPFTDDNQIDVDSVRRYARHFLARGVAGFLAPAVAGEVDTLSEDERELLVRIFLEEAGGRVPVIGGASDSDSTVRLRQARRFIDMGCGGVLAYVPYESESAYVTSIHELGKLNPPFLMVQDLDQGAAQLPASLLARLHREVPCLTWAKVETGDRCHKITALREMAGPTLNIGSAGPDMIELLDRGVDAYLPSLYPAVYCRIWALYRGGLRSKAAAVASRLMPCLSFAVSHQPIRWHLNKAMLQAEGIFTTTRLRRAAPAPDRFEERLIGELAEYALALSAELSDQP